MTEALRHDLTARARIRNSALALFARHGVEGASMRRVAADAGVTVGLVVHHFGTKERLREEVETYVVDRFGAAIRSVPVQGSARDVARGRDEAVATMLATEPDLVTYLRRALLGLSGPDDHLLRRLTELAAEEVARARAAGVADTDRRGSTQTIRTMTRQLGQLLLQPMIDAMWEQLEGQSESPDKPALVVRVE
ncbi:TetR/AcrR family transcriptional regulator [Janibacter limosus]|nr:TetR/AcrR family transcriptional regulator [Janibacter limosus]